MVRAASGLQLGPDLVDDDDFGHVVLDRLDHHRVLLGRGADLHPARVADARVRDVAVAGDLVRVSTMTTRLPRSSASTRATSRSIVVLPTPGRPSSRMLCPPPRCRE